MSDLGIDVSTMNADELKRLADAVNDQMKQRKKKEFDAKMSEILRLAAEIGVEVSFPGLKNERTKSGKTGSVAPKFIHPTDAQLTWTGRGRKPLWVDSHLKDGGTLEELMIKNV
jgi:DNA-binding protein H-NS